MNNLLIPSLLEPDPPSLPLFLIFHFHMQQQAILILAQTRSNFTVFVAVLLFLVRALGLAAVIDDVSSTPDPTLVRTLASLTNQFLTLSPAMPKAKRYRAM